MATEPGPWDRLTGHERAVIVREWNLFGTQMPQRAVPGLMSLVSTMVDARSSLALARARERYIDGIVLSAFKLGLTEEGPVGEGPLPVGLRLDDYTLWATHPSKLLDMIAGR